MAGECLLTHLVQALKVLVGACQRCLGILPNLGKPLGQEARRITDQRQYVAVCPFVLGPGFFDKALKRRNDFRNRRDTGGVGTAFQGMQRPREIVRVGGGGFVARSLQVFLDGLQMGFGFVLEDIQQHRIHFVFSGQGIILNAVFRSDGTGRCFLCRLCVGVHQRHGGGIGNFAIGQGIGPRLHGRCVQARRLAFLKIGDQRRHRIGDILKQLGNIIIHEHAAVDHPVQHVLDRPRQLPDHGSANHPATAFQGMKGPPNFCQGTAVIVLT